jgi:amino acid adenylation domain-containing protein
MDRFTQFPAVNDDGNDVHIVPWHLDIQLPSEVLALSWAILLRAFTTDENPVFLLNGAPVKADLSIQTVQPADLATVSDLSVKHTAVVLGDPLFEDDRHPPVLRWTLDPTSKSGALCATGGMDAPFLYELGKQLKQIVQEQASLQNIHVELSALDVPTPAISNAEPAILPGPGLLHELALRGITEANHAIEFLAADGSVRCLSYRDLDQLSSKLASEIAHASTINGVQRVVPVLLPQSVELYISWLAILKSGAAFCPLNTDAPTDRIEFILQDVAASVVITNDALASKIPPNEHLSILTVDNLSNEPIEPFTIECSSSHLAYVMYTSGSTGRPKGVGVSHLAVTQSLLAHDDLIPPFKRFLQFASPTFDVSVFEVFFPIMRGATLIGSERENMLLDISHVMTTMKVDAAELTPTVAGELLRTRAAAPSLRVLLTIGEMLTRHVVDEFGRSETGDGILHGMYGPTEAAIHCTAATHFKSKDRVNMIGTTFKTVSAYIMSLPSDDSNELRTLSLGQIGELVLGGPQLADGYINRPKENAKAFIDNPLYGRLYRTGDKARMLPSGEIECFGRISSGQVKLRGQRIELGEIEHVITRASGVRSAVTIVIDGNLVAFVLVTDKGVTESNLRDVCRQLLPRFMIPGEFVLVDQFPQLPSGKTDRKTLEADFAQYRSTAQSFNLECRDEKEEAIVSCVAGVIGRRLAPTESLASAGLDSLAAIRLASHLLDAGIRLGVATLLEVDSVEGIWQLATNLEATGSTGDVQAALQTISEFVSDAGATMIDAMGLSMLVSGVVPCSHIQQAMILETIRDDKAYCNWIELEFEPSVNSAELKSAFAKLAEHNEILRSGFVEIGLKDHSYARFTWKDVDEHVLQVEGAFEYDVSLVAGHDVLNPFRVQIKDEKDRLRALVHIHHALYDGWSWQLMLKDLRGILAGEQPTSRSTYTVVTNFFIEQKLDKSSTESSTYWCDQLQGLNPAPFPVFHGRTDLKPATLHTARILQIPISKLNEVTHHHRVSRQTIFQAAFCYILSTYLGTKDVTFGTVFSGRTLPLKGIETILGPCIRTLPTRMDLSKMQNISDLLLAITNMNRKSLEHGSLPLQDIKKASGIDLDRSLFDTALVWQESIWADEHDVFREVDAGEFLEFALLLEFEPREDCVFARATFQHAVLSLEQADILLQQIDAVAAILIDRVELPIGEIRELLPTEALSVYHGLAATNYESSLTTGVEQVASTDPNRVAVEVISSNSDTSSTAIERITYGELNSRANGLAHLLLHVGVMKTDLVSILLTSSIDLYVSVLGIAKAGAAVVLLSPGSESAINSLLSSTKSKFCIVDSVTEKDHRLPSLKIVQRIHLSYSLDVYHGFNIPYKNQGSDIAYAEAKANNTTETIVISRQNLDSSITALSKVYPTPTGSKILSSQSTSMFEAFFAWQNGVTLCSASDITKISLEQACQDMSITHLHLTPSLASHVDPEAVPSVQYLLSMGEHLTPRLHRNWAGKGLYHAHSSEALVHACTISEIGISTSIRDIGQPLGNTFAIITDAESLCALPRGAVGEISFGGDQLGKCLPGAKISLAGRFVDHPEYGRIYRTGDYGRMLPDGTLILSPGSGPEKAHIQIVDLDEVDRAFLALDFVRESVNMILNSKLGKQQLVVFWVPSKILAGPIQIEEATNDLFAELSKTLPISSIPDFLVLVEDISLTPSYKTDYLLLTQRLEQLSKEELAVFSPKLNANGTDDSLTNVEKIISIALSEVTGTDQSHIDKHTSFYRLGLDSLSAISFSRKLQESGCGRLAVSTILRYSSVSQLASVISPMVNENGHESAQAKVHGSTVVFDETFIRQVEDGFKATGTAVQDIYPCTPLQEAMLAAGSGGQSAYFNHLLLLVHSDTEAMQAAWARMMQRHGILRTCFTQTNEKRFAYAQVILDTSALPWYQVETRSLESVIKENKSKFEEISPVNGQLPYSLTVITDPDTQKTHLLLSIHHALYDGEGISQLLHELQLSLSSQELPEGTPFHRFIDYMISVDHGISDEYWDRYLAGVAPTLLLTANADDSASQQIHTSLQASFGSFKQQCKDLSVSPLNVFHAAWARLLLLYTDSADVCFGNVFSCRTIPLDGVDGIVGPCFNTLPIRIKSSSTATNNDILKIAQKSNSEILPHQLSPLRRIQRRVLGAGSRLFDTLLVFQNKKTDLDSGIWELLQDEGNMGFPLICEIVPDESADTIQICLHFQESHISQIAAEKIAQDFVTLVEHISQYTSAQASDKRILGVNIPRVFEQVSQHKAVVFRTTKSRPSRPWSRQEEAVRNILCKFSDVEPENISQDMTIFQLGLDSINAVQVSVKLRGLGYKISSGDILEAASIDQIASLLTERENVGEEAVYDFEAFQSQHLQVVCKQLGISSENIQSLRPCTPVQNGMLAMFTHSHGGVYFNRMALNFSAPLQLMRLKEAWAKVTAQHEMLRTGFVQLHDQQHPFAMITYQNTELPWYGSAESPIQEKTILENLHQPPWGIEVETGESTRVMHFSALHAIYDAQSLSSIFADVKAAYEGSTLTPRAPITATLGPILIESKGQSESANFWKDLAPEVHPSKFPDLHPIRSDERRLLNTSIRCAQPRKTLDDACRDLGVTLQAAGQVAWGRLLSAYTGELNVTFGTVLSGRNLSTAAQDAVFPCLVTVPTPLRIDGANRDLLNRTLKRNALLVKNQFAPLSNIQRWLGSDEPLFDTLFVYQKFASAAEGWNVVDEETKIDVSILLNFTLRYV